MAHLARTVADEVLVRGYITLGTDLVAIDENIYKSINGDDGGTWSPSTSINIYGEGVIVAGLWVMEGAGVTATTSTGSKYITFNRGTASDYFGYDTGHPGRSASILYHLHEAYSHDPRSIDFLVIDGVRTKTAGARFFVPLPVYGNAAKIDSVELRFRVGTAHANVPEYLPRIRVFAVSSEGVVIPLRSKDATTDVDGFQFFGTPASGAAWYNTNSYKTQTYTCNVTLAVDLSEYTFYVEIIDESGTDSQLLNTFSSVKVAFSSITIFDGRN